MGGFFCWLMLELVLWLCEEVDMVYMLVYDAFSCLLDSGERFDGMCVVISVLGILLVFYLL